MDCEIKSLGTLKNYKYVVIIARHRNKWVMCRHKERTTWEPAGGHVEIGETPLDAARRELYEETGAIEYEIIPLFDYTSIGGNGMLYYAHVEEFGDLPVSEMEEIMYCDSIPLNLTYMTILPVLFKYFIDTFGDSLINNICEICVTCDTRLRLGKCNGREGTFKYCFRPAGSVSSIDGRIQPFNELDELCKMLSIFWEMEVTLDKLHASDYAPYMNLLCLDFKDGNKYPIGYITKSI